MNLLLLTGQMDKTLGITLCVVLTLVGILLGVTILFLVYHFSPKLKAKKASAEAEKIIKNAEIKADQITKNAKIDAKTTTAEMKKEAEKEIKERKQTVVELEKKLDARENQINKRDDAITAKEQSLEDRKNQYDKRIASLTVKETELQNRIDNIILELEKVANLSQKEAQEEIMRRVEEKMSTKIALYIKNKEDEAEELVEAKAKNLLALAIDKYAQDVTCERTCNTISIPNDDMKGRIIGREGRNIKSLESLLGVDIIIDDTPNCITISSFNPIRREIAKQTLDTLIKDGRIQPGRIEEILKKVTSEIENSIRKTGEQTCLRLGLPRINKELYTYIGRMKYRTSYGQNVLEHSIQVAYLAGIMAAELGLDVTMAKRAGLLHDIGKAADFELEGSHVEVGSRLAKKFGEPDIVINAIESHHDDVAKKYVISNIVQAADTLSAARPGARSETLENYIQRIEKIEEICKSFDGVSNCFAVQSGREVRVSVIPEKINDQQTIVLAQQIKDKLESDATYPGQVKVTVIREWRATEVAK